MSREEKGYGVDEIDLRIVDIGESYCDFNLSVFLCNSAKGENFAPTFLRLNPKGELRDIIPYSTNETSSNGPNARRSSPENFGRRCRESLQSNHRHQGPYSRSSPFST
jgi:hypothetical protein